MPEIGQTISHYRITEKLGQGGMGEVLLADDLSLGRKVALKFLSRELQQDPVARKRLLREARAAAALDHPNICTIHEVAEAKEQSFIVMEYVTGSSLKDRLEQGSLPPKEALPIAIEVAEALETAHGKRIIHRDIKPANIMLTQTGHAKVMDFGLAKQLVPTEGMGSAAETITALTSDGSTVGTLAYMSPEQLRSQAVDARSDIWALGVTFYEMVAGTRPFQGQSGVDVTSAILNQTPRPLPSQVPAEIGAVIGRCLEKEPGNRYRQAVEVRAALQAIQAGTAAPWAAWRYRLARHRWLMLAAALVIVAAVLLRLDVAGLVGRLAGGETRAVKLAVLPFANPSGDPAQEHLSNGFTRELITQLGGLHPAGLSVIASTSVMRYKKGDTPIDQVGRDLKVDYVLEGSAQREANRVRITAQLIRVSDQTQIWAHPYEHEISSIMLVQSELAKSMAEALALRLLPAERERLASARTVNPEAYDAYLKGSALWQTLKPADFDAAQRYFEQALAKDSSYAPAHAGLAFVWQCRQFPVRVASISEAGPKAKAEVSQALALDGNSAEAHEALAAIRTWSDWDWTGAEPEWRRALELNPSNANAQAYYAHFLAIRGRVSEALPHSERAIELDPFNALYHALHAVVLEYARRYDDALAAARTALSIQPGLGFAQNQFQFIYIAAGMRNEALADQRLIIARDPERLAAFERGFAESGYEGAQRALADMLAVRREKSQTNPGGALPYQAGIASVNIALRYLGAGDKDRAIEWLYKAYADRDSGVTYLGRSYWAPLRSDPRFQTLIRRIGLPPM
jgi:TolB-like protein/Tfp pilus assembly protein PilF/predicted Ser/Thr protein kinase